MKSKNVLAALDVGSQTTKALICKSDGKSLEFIANTFSFSQGVRKGIVEDSKRASKVIKNTLFLAQKKANSETDEIITSINGKEIKLFASQGLVSVSRADQKISAEDVERVLKAAQAINLPSNFEIIDILSKEFIVDGQGGIKDPVGLKGIRLQVNAFLLTVFSPFLNELEKSILDAGFQIIDFIPSCLASATAVLTEKEKELGVAVIDIGAETTGMAVYEDGKLVHLVILPIGSANITNDIAICLRTTIEIAEEVKKEFARAFLRREKNKRVIKIQHNNETFSFSQSILRKIVESRLKQLFSILDKELKKISKEKLLPAGIVLTGGGSKLKGIGEFAKKEFKLPTRIGVPKGIIGLPEDPSLSCLSGLILEAQKINKELIQESFFGRMKKFLKNFLP